MTPEQLNKAIRMSITDKNFAKDYNNAAGQPVNIDKIAPDIVIPGHGAARDFAQLVAGQTIARLA